MSRFKMFDLVEGIVGKRNFRNGYNTQALKRALYLLQQKYRSLFANSIRIIKIAPLENITNYQYAPNTVYGRYRTLIYDHGFKLNGSGPGNSIDEDIANGNVQALDKPNVWGPAAQGNANPTNIALNRSGIWFNSQTAPGPFNFEVTFNAVCEGAKMYIGVAADNAFRFELNGQVIINNYPGAVFTPYYSTSIFTWSLSSAQYWQFMYWHIYEIESREGVNKITLSGNNPDGPALPGYFGLEIYDDSIENIKNAELDPAYLTDPVNYPFTQNYYTNLNMLFSTRYIRSSPSLANGQELIFQTEYQYQCVNSNDVLPKSVITLGRQLQMSNSQTRKDLEKAIELVSAKLEGCC